MVDLQRGVVSPNDLP